MGTTKREILEPKWGILPKQVNEKDGTDKFKPNKLEQLKYWV
jgi:hypothetical protein